MQAWPHCLFLAGEPVTKDNAGTSGIKTYVFCLADLLRGNE